MVGKFAAAARQFVLGHQLASFIAAALIVAGVMTAVSLQLYARSGAQRLDLSRPGYEQVRQDVNSAKEEPNFSASGALDAAAIKDFDSRLATAQNNLDQMGDFSGEVFSDENLGLSTNGEAEQ